MSQETKNASRIESLEAPQTSSRSCTQNSSSVLIYIPLCYNGIGPGPCGDEAYCLTRNQPMCGGHTAVELDSPEGREYARNRTHLVGAQRDWDEPVRGMSPERWNSHIVFPLHNYEMSRACGHCSHQRGRIDRKRGQDVVSCESCGQYVYNASRAETGLPG
jgi:hypothetical protein